MRPFILFILGVLLLTACDSRPHGVLSERKMANVLYDIYLADASSDVKGYYASMDSLKRQNYQFILHKEDVSVAEFDSSVTWYARHSDEHAKLYDRVITRLAALQKDVNAGKYKDPIRTKNDTLDVWNRPRKFDLKAQEYRDKIFFHFDNSQFKKGDELLLTYLHKIDNVDKSTHKRLLIKVKYTNNKVDSLVSFARNDGKWRRYKVSFPLSRVQNVVSIDGWILDCDSVAGKQSAIVESIRCLRVAYADKQPLLHKKKKHWWQL